MHVSRPGEERGSFDFGWLRTQHTFSFGDYHDPAWMGFSVLRVINEDHVAPGTGFGMHGHRDMEILTWVLEGAIEHRDSLGHGEVLRPGEIQRMSAGRGIRHAETNPSTTEGLHLLQIWLLPAKAGTAPSYEQKPIDPVAMEGRFHPVATPDGAGGGVTIHQDARLSVARLDPGAFGEQVVGAGRKVWIQVAKGLVEVDGIPMAAGDGAGFSEVQLLRVAALERSEVLLFDLP